MDCEPPGISIYTLGLAANFWKQKQETYKGKKIHINPLNLYSSPVSEWEPLKIYFCLIFL